MEEQEYTFKPWDSDKNHEYVMCSVCDCSFQIEKGVEKVPCPNTECKNTLRREK